MYTAKDVHDACLAAAAQCPQFAGFTADAQELVNGNAIPVGQLHTQGTKAVIAYWCNPDTVGGTLLFAQGYAKALPPDLAELFAQVREMVAKARFHAGMEYC